jgi:hypothetical protein
MNSGQGCLEHFRLAMIIGSQHRPGAAREATSWFSFVTPAKHKSITIEQIAEAMIATSLDTPPKTDLFH